MCTKAKPVNSGITIGRQTPYQGCSFRYLTSLCPAAPAMGTLMKCQESQYTAINGLQSALAHAQSARVAPRRQKAGTLHHGRVRGQVARAAVAGDQHLQDLDVHSAALKQQSKQSTNIGIATLPGLQHIRGALTIQTPPRVSTTPGLCGVVSSLYRAWGRLKQQALVLQARGCGPGRCWPGTSCSALAQRPPPLQPRCCCCCRLLQSRLL